MTSSATPDETDLSPPRRRRLVLAICCMSLLIVSLDNTALNVALPALQRDLQAPVSGLQWTLDAYTLALASFLMLAGFLFLSTLHLQDDRGLSALEAGIRLLPMAVMTAVFAPLSGHLIGVRGSRLPLVPAGANMTASGVLLAYFGAEDSGALLFVSYVLFGIGFGLVNAPVTDAAVSGMPRSRAGLAASIASTSRQIGSALGVAVVGAAVAAGADGTGWWIITGCGGAVTLLGLLTTGRRAEATAERVAGGLPSAPAGSSPAPPGPTTRPPARDPARQSHAGNPGALAPGARQACAVNAQRTVKISKYLAKHLRHEPERIGIVLDAQGWVAVEDLLKAAAGHGFPITRAELEEVVDTNDKRRYVIDPGRDRIRASQGHSVTVDLDLPAVEPPDQLFHGTTGRFLDAIRAEGLRPMNRHAVHLSPDRGTAERVGARRGRPVVLPVDAGAMHRDGHTFRLSENGVWLVDAVPPKYLGGTADGS